MSLLLENLEFELATEEKLVGGETLYIIPIKDAVKAKKNLDENTVLNLAAVFDRSGSVSYAQIVLYFPQGNQKVPSLPKNCLSQVLSYKPAAVNGLFKFLTASGTICYQINYINHKVNSIGMFTEKSSTQKGGRVTGCTAYYLVTTYYDEDGIAVYETTEYIGTFCDGCGNPEYESHCPGGGEGGGNGEESCITQFQRSAMSQKETVQTADETADSRAKTYPWKVYMVASVFTTAYLQSKEKAVHEKGADGYWRFSTFSHVGVTMTGTAIGWTLSAENVSAIPTFIAEDGMQKRLARMDLNFDAVISLICKGFPITSVDANQHRTNTWHVNE